MGSQSHLPPPTLPLIKDELRHIYDATLLQIAQKLPKDQQEELQFLCTHKINSETTKVIDTLNIFIKLEHTGKISWENVRFLKKILNQLFRLDLEESLTKYEIKRDLALLLALYASKRQGWRNTYQRFSPSVEKLSDLLLNVTNEISRTATTDEDKLDLTFMRSVLAEEDIKQVLVEFEQEIESKFTADSWSKLTMFVVIAGELVFEALANGEKQDAMNICFISVDKICCRMQELRGGWVSLSRLFLNFFGRAQNTEVVLIA